MSSVSILVVAEHLPEEVQYELDSGWPFKPTADCGIILGLHTNYTMKKKKLVDEDQGDAIQMVQEELGLDKSVWIPDMPLLYFVAASRCFRFLHV